MKNHCLKSPLPGAPESKAFLGCRMRFMVHAGRRQAQAYSLPLSRACLMAQAPGCWAVLCAEAVFLDNLTQIQNRRRRNSGLKAWMISNLSVICYTRAVTCQHTLLVPTRQDSTSCLRSLTSVSVCVQASLHHRIRQHYRGSCCKHTELRHRRQRARPSAHAVIYQSASR